MEHAVIIGAGGKDGGGAGGLSEDPDTLSSVAFARFIDLIAEGPIVGLVNGDRSIYLDGVPLRNVEGTPNYKPFTFKTTLGTQSQPTIPGFAGTQSEIVVGVPVSIASGHIDRSVSDANADSVRVTISVNGLSQTDPENGKMKGTTLEYKILVRVAGGTWVLGHYDTIEGKTSARYQRSYEVSLSQLGVGPYEVRVERVTADSTSALLVNALNWDSYAVINYELFSYPNSALVAVEIDGRYFSQVPQRSYHVKGLEVRVPSNYNAVTRVYTGIWDGNFQIAWTNNPAWCFYDLCTNTRYGLGNRITSGMISKWALYEIGKYCDGLVPSGLTTNIFDRTTDPSFSTSGVPRAGVVPSAQNMEPRFTLNCVINTKDDAFKVLNNLATVFRGMPYWAASQTSLTQDRPTDPSMIWTNANVIGGSFRYEGSARSQRHTTVSVGWNDPSEDFKQKFEYVEDREGLDRYGVRPMETVAFGCTSRSQARRFGLWILYTERLETDAITFSVGMDSANVRPGNVGQILDSNRAGVRWGGRLKAYTSSLITIDAPLTLAVGSYVMSIIAIDGTVISKAVNITVAGTYTDLPITVVASLVPTTGAVWTLASTELTPMLGRVVSVKMNKDNTFDITCLQHNPSKYAAIEQGVYLTLPNYSVLKYTQVHTVTNIRPVENSYKTSVSSVVQTNVEIAWDAVSDPLIRGYRLKATAQNGSIVNFPELSEPFYTMSGVTPDTYTFEVSAVNQLGIVGAITSMTLAVTGIDLRPPSNVSGFNAAVILTGVRFGWDVDNEVDYLETELHIESTWNDATVPIFRGRANTWVWASPPIGTSSVVAKNRDTSGNVSISHASVSVTVAVPQPPASFTAALEPFGVRLTSQPSPSHGVVRYEYRYGASWSSGTVIAADGGTGYLWKVQNIGSFTFWVAAADFFGNYSTPISASVTVTAPQPPASFTASIEPFGVRLTSQPSPSSGVVSYEYRYGASWAAGTFITADVGAGYLWKVQNIGSFTFWVAAIDMFGNYSTPISSTAAIVGPSIGSLASAISGGINLALTWAVAVGSFAVAGYEVRYGTTWAGATVVDFRQTTSYIEAVKWGGSRLYWVAALDVKGNYGTPVNLNVTINAPSVVSGVRADVVDNNALLYWTAPAIGSGQLAIDRYEVRKGVSFAGGTLIGSNGNSTFTSVFEQASGTYSYWVEAVDSAGNVGTAVAIIATINQPPDYVLRNNYDSVLAGTFVNFYTEAGTVLGPVDTTQTWTTHYTANSWATPDAQIAAGFPIYADPSLASGSYEEVIDYGAAVPATVVTATINTTLIAGAITVTPTLSWKLLAGDPWTVLPAGTSSSLIPSFRYVRVHYDFACTAGANLIRVNGLNVKLAVKLRNDSGAVSSVAVGGTAVTFGYPFVAADTPVFQPAGSTPLIPVVIYVGGANPTGFTIRLFNLSGTDVGSSSGGSWTARGY